MLDRKDRQSGGTQGSSNSGAAAAGPGGGSEMFDWSKYQGGSGDWNKGGGSDGGHTSGWGGKDGGGGGQTGGPQGAQGGQGGGAQAPSFMSPSSGNNLFTGGKIIVRVGFPYT